MNKSKLIAIFLAVFAITSHADTAAQLKAAIEENIGGTGTLSAAVSGNTVTVTGTKTGATDRLSLNIDAGVSVIWKASLSGTPGNWPFIRKSGTGSFEVQSDGKIETTNARYTIQISGGDITISGGTVSNNIAF